MPIVASMGGIAGTQTLTLVIRGIALGHVGRANLLWLLNREFTVAALNGVFWAALVAVTAAFAFRDPILGAVIAVAMVVNILVAAVAGTLLPSALNRLSIDPAIAGRPAHSIRLEPGSRAPFRDVPQLRHQPHLPGPDC